MERRSRTPKAADVAAWLLLRLLDWHLPQSAASPMVTAGRKVRFPVTLDGVQFLVTVEETKK